MLAFYLALLDDEQSQRRFEGLYNKYRKQMLALALSILHNTHGAEDAVHEAFLCIARNMAVVSKITNETDMRNYLLKTAKNASLNMLSQKKRRERVIGLDSVSDIPDDSFMQALADKFSYDDLVEVLREINRDYFDVLYYHYVMELTLLEVAKLLGRKLSTVKQQLARGKKLAAAKLKKREMR
jgi:RNA polymerase sigma-70 factor (ECF subfamily)